MNYRRCAWRRVQIHRDEAARAQLVGKAREHVLRFDWAEVARRTLELYGEYQRVRLRTRSNTRAYARIPARLGCNDPSP